MDESEREPPEQEKPLSRADVVRLIKDQGGPVGLDLREANLENANLNELDLHRADLSHANLQSATLRSANLERAELGQANLQEADLRQTNLQRADLSLAKLQEAHLSESQLQEAILYRADLQGADMRWADLQRARLAYGRLRDTNLEAVNWGDYKLGEEIRGDFSDAASTYRALKQRHTEAGIYDIAGEFHYREMEARRKLAWRGEPDFVQPRRLPYAVTMYALRFLYGYGERPERVIAWAAAVVFGLALVHWAFGTVSGGFLEALYYSAVSFPALGYGHWAPEPQGWAGRFLGAGESFLGVFMMALFLVTFTRKMTR
jgi:hypothetical protein